MGKEINLGSNVYKLKDNQICKFMVVKRITTETLEGETISFIIKDDHDNESERTLSELENNYFSTPREVTDYLLSEYKESTKINNSVRKINLDLYETDGYTDKHRDYVSVPMQYIKGGTDYYNVQLTEEGVEWFEKNVFAAFDNGGYYRLRRISEEEVKRLLSNAYDIIDIFG